MRIPRSILFFNITILIVFLLFPQTNSFSQESKASNKPSTENPIIIHSNTLELDQEKKLIVFEGNVKAKTEGMMIDCQKMLIYYLGSPIEKEASAESNRIDKIIALEDVIINRFDGGMARAGKAVFFHNEQKVVLTDNPFVQQGPDFVEGHRIIIFLNESRSIVEGNETKRVKATIFPKEEKGKK
jgi:lipopolysaccharide export system protein LptA